MEESKEGLGSGLLDSIEQILADKPAKDSQVEEKAKETLSNSDHSQSPKLGDENADKKSVNKKQTENLSVYEKY